MVRSPRPSAKPDTVFCAGTCRFAKRARAARPGVRASATAKASGGCAGTAQACYRCPVLSRRAILRRAPVEHGGRGRPQRGGWAAAALLSAASARKARQASNGSLWFTSDSRAFHSWHARSLRLGGGIREAIKLIPAAARLQVVDGAGHGVPPATATSMPGWLGMSETSSWKKGTDLSVTT